MAEPFLSEIKIMSFNFAPRGWAQCNGQLLPINQNQALFSLLGTTFGGNGQTNFALPDFRARVPIHVGGGTFLGQRSGQEAHTLTIAEIPTHTHVLQAKGPGDSGSNLPNLDDRFLSNSAPAQIYHNGAGSPSKLATNTVGNTGGSQPHNNMAPFLVLNFCIALQGIFPSQN
jgi:microcystin-dependent protein